jgi:hypothetical protein
VAPLYGIATSTDIYPLLTGVLFANGIPYAPRPVLQSYAAYTRELLELNARHLESDNAGTTLLVDVDPFDMHYPAFDDSLSIQPMLAWYDAGAVTPAGLELIRSKHRRRILVEPITRIEATVGVPVPLPRENGLVWATIDVRQTWRGRIRSFLFKPSPLGLTVRTAKRGESRFLLVPSIARTGFVLSPQITERDDLFDVLRRTPTDPSEIVSAVALTPFGNAQSNTDYSSRYVVTLWRLIVE